MSNSPARTTARLCVKQARTCYQSGRRGVPLCHLGSAVLSATTNDHQGARLAPNIVFQYHAETSGQLSPASSRITSQTLMASEPRLARQQPMAAPAASLRTDIGTTL